MFRSLEGSQIAGRPDILAAIAAHMARQRGQQPTNRVIQLSEIFAQHGQVLAQQTAVTQSSTMQPTMQQQSSSLLRPKPRLAAANILPQQGSKVQATMQQQSSSQADQGSKVQATAQQLSSSQAQQDLGFDKWFAAKGLKRAHAPIFNMPTQAQIAADNESVDGFILPARPSDTTGDRAKRDLNPNERSRPSLFILGQPKPQRENKDN